MSTSPLGRLFGPSPFRPIQGHMKTVESCAAEVEPLLAAFAQEDRDAMREHRRKIDELEGQADQQKNDLRGQLPRSLFLPVDRRDLLELLHLQDSIADAAQDVAEYLHLGPPALPDAFRTPLDGLARSSLAAVRAARTAVDELDELLETGFRGREADSVETLLDEVGQLEHDADTEERELMKLLLRDADNLSRADFLLWYELIQKIGSLADYAEDVADRLRLLIAR